MACDGKRDKVKFKRKGDMDDMDLVSDFRLLEEVGRGLDQCRRDKIKRSTRQGTEVKAVDEVAAGGAIKRH